MSTRTVRATELPQRLYHRIGGFICFFGKDQRVIQDGVATVIDSEKIQCTPCGSHDYGWYLAERQDIRDYLLSRGDFLTELEFLEATRSPEDKLKDAANVADQMRREIAEKNQLIADLQMRQRQPAPMKSAG